jgi:hypothetical protein
MSTIRVHSRTQVVVVHPDKSVSVINAGPPGPPGSTAPPVIYRFEQNTPAYVWDVVHNLDRETIPSVVVEGEEITADILHISSNQFTVTFAQLKTGFVLYV